MRKYQLHTKTAGILKRFPALCKRMEGAEQIPEAAGAPLWSGGQVARF